MPEIKVRLASAADAEALCALNLAFNGEDGGEGLADAAMIRASLAANPMEIVCLAEVSGKPAGFCCMLVKRSMCYATPSAELTELYVAPEARRRGVAEALVRFAEAQCRERFGVDGFHLLTGCGNEAAQAFYRKVEYQEKKEMYFEKG